MGATAATPQRIISNSTVIRPGTFLSPVLENTSADMQSSGRMHSQIFMKRSSYALTLVLYLGFLLLLLELLGMMGKYNFFGLLCSLAVLAIFGLNYFDKKYLRLALVVLVLGVMIDILWIFCKAWVRVK